MALVEIVVGSLGGNLLGITPNEWITYLASVAILLTFLAGTELDPVIVRKHLGSTLSIGVVGFVVPYLGVLIFARWLALAAGADRRDCALDDVSRRSSTP
ncbi:MAG: hypothetical protein ABSA62_01950 [Methyloceanibacter sp.]